MSKKLKLSPSELVSSLLQNEQTSRLFDLLTPKHDKHGIGYVATEEEEKQPALFDPSTDFVPVDVHETYDVDEHTLVSTFRKTPSTKRSAPSYDALYDAVLHAELQRCKNKLDAVDKKTFLSARSRANPFEAIKHRGFMDRASFKLAEIDCVFEILHDFYGRNLRFADVCGGPGGWTEYVMWRRSAQHPEHTARGFGMTLRDTAAHLDWNLYKMNQWSQTMCQGLLCPGSKFFPVYGGKHKGDVTRPENMQAFIDRVQGVDVFLADGGFDVTRDPNAQERLSQRLLLCQLALGIKLLVRGGHLVCKLFDAFTQPTQDMLYAASLCFESLTLYKPVSSRPANSERYLVCKNFAKDDTCKRVASDMFRLADALEKSPLPEDASIDASPAYATTMQRYRDGLANDAAFREYLRERIETMAMLQITHLKRIFVYVNDPYLQSVDQQRVKDAFLHRWEVWDTPSEYHPSRPELEQYMQSFHPPYEPKHVKPLPN